MRKIPQWVAAALILAPLSLAVPGYGNPAFWQHEWPNTDFSKTTVDNWVEILSGGPPKDGIPALSDPSFVNAHEEN